MRIAKNDDTLHINNIFKEGELQPKATVKEYLTAQMEGKRQVKRKIVIYNPDIIISVGYRVKSQRGTQFRIWANKVFLGLHAGTQRQAEKNSQKVTAF